MRKRTPTRTSGSTGSGSCPRRQTSLTPTGGNDVAILLFFKKVREDDQEVAYQFGENPKAPQRQLVISKQSHRSWAMHQVEDMLLREAVRRIRSPDQQPATWPPARSRQA